MYPCASSPVWIFRVFMFFSLSLSLNCVCQYVLLIVLFFTFFLFLFTRPTPKTMKNRRSLRRVWASLSDWTRSIQPRIASSNQERRRETTDPSTLYQPQDHPGPPPRAPPNPLFRPRKSLDGPASSWTAFFLESFHTAPSPSPSLLPSSPTIFSSSPAQFHADDSPFFIFFHSSPLPSFSYSLTCLDMLLKIIIATFFLPAFCAISFRIFRLSILSSEISGSQWFFRPPLTVLVDDFYFSFHPRLTQNSSCFFSIFDTVVPAK